MRLIDADALIEDLEYDVELDARALDDMDFVGKRREIVQFDLDCTRNAIRLVKAWLAEDAPTEQLEIIKCKDCKYLLTKGSFCSKDMCCLRGMEHYHSVDIHNDFCSWAERKEK